LIDPDPRLPAPAPPGATTSSRFLVVRDADARDHAAIVEFNLRLALETEAKQLDPAVLARGVARALADPGGLRYWVAETREQDAGQEGTVVGQAAVSREWSDWRDGWIWWFQSVYVHPDHRRRGVFRALHQQITRAARAAGDVIGLRLYVEVANERAQRTYQGLGFKPGGYHVYEDFGFDPTRPRGD
jgi:GNAT superfamily N-acetyltransferase